MAGRNRQVNLKKRSLMVEDERDLVIQTLRDQVRALEAERDQGRIAIEFLTKALRRRGCCDGHSNGAHI